MSQMWCTTCSSQFQLCITFQQLTQIISSIASHFWRKPLPLPPISLYNPFSRPSNPRVISYFVPVIAIFRFSQPLSVLPTPISPPGPSPHLRAPLLAHYSSCKWQSTISDRINRWDLHQNSWDRASDKMTSNDMSE